MIDGIFAAENYTASKQLLDAAAVRHRAIASNLANVETPGYQRVDLSKDFVSQLQQALKNRDPEARPTSAPWLEVDPEARAVRQDGNTVSLEKEMMAMNRNALEYDYLADRVSSNIKRLKMAITGKA